MPRPWGPHYIRRDKERQSAVAEREQSRSQEWQGRPTALKAHAEPSWHQEKVPLFPSRHTVSSAQAGLQAPCHSVKLYLYTQPTTARSGWPSDQTTIFEVASSAAGKGHRALYLLPVGLL